jgi:hypothetical protein
MAFRGIFTNFDQGSIWDGIFTPVNGKLKLLGEFRRSFIFKTDRLEMIVSMVTAGGSAAIEETTFF